MPVSILLIQLEFSTWKRARAWTYSAQLAFEEGFEANGVNFVTILALEEFSPEKWKTWFAQIRDVCESNHFDQVWVELVHLNLDHKFLEWLSSVAPVRLALIGESLEYAPEVYRTAPALLERRTLVENRLRYMTHCLVADEIDEARLNANGPVKAMWWQTSIPKKYICLEAPIPEVNCATFFGALYGDRKEWLSMDILKDIIIRTGSIIDKSHLPKIFDEIQSVAFYLLNRTERHEQFRADYLKIIRVIRRELFALILNDFKAGCAVVNLPHFVQAYSGRVVEAMAAGRPVITWEIPDRPRTRALFEDGREILMFPKNNPEVLARHIRTIQNEPEFGSTIAAQARDKVLQNFTTEKLVARILGWINNGKLIDNADVEPVFCKTEFESSGVPDIDMLLSNLRSHVKHLGWRDNVGFKLLCFKRHLSARLHK